MISRANLPAQCLVRILPLLKFDSASDAVWRQSFYHQAELNEDERARSKRMMLEKLEHETFFKQAARTFGIGNGRDFVLGMNDGLVEVLGAVRGSGKER